MRIRRAIGACALVAALAAVAYARLPENGFVDYDDVSFIVEGPTLSDGAHVLAAWGFTKETYWHPLAVTSLAATRALFGLNPAAFHLENLAWHVASALILLLGLAAATGRLGPSTAAAALFAVHPVNVESVAWAVERRNVLAVFFGLLAVVAYVRWTRARTAARQAAVLLLGALALMSKALVAPLPALLLAVDVWPLGRVDPSRPRELFRAAVEKLPVAALCAAGALVVNASLLEQQGAAEPPPLGLRAANALVVVVRHLAHLAAPVELTPFYPYPDAIPAWQVLGAGAAVAAISAVAWVARGRAPYLLAGWAWFLAGLLPTLGLRQAGQWPALADRHAYLAAVGLFVAVAWGAADLLARAPRIARLAAAAAPLAVLAALTWRQVGFWRDSVTLFERALLTAPESAHVRVNLGTVLAVAGREEEAIPHLAAAVRLDPRRVTARTNLGRALAAVGRTGEAMAELSMAVRLDPADATAHANLGELLLRTRPADAVPVLERAVALAPRDANALANLGSALNQAGRYADTAARLEAARDVIAGSPEARFNLAVAYAVLGRGDAAWREAAAVRQLSPELGASLERYLATAAPR